LINSYTCHRKDAACSGREGCGDLYYRPVLFIRCGPLRSYAAHNTLGDPQKEPTAGGQGRDRRKLVYRPLENCFLSSDLLMLRALSSWQIQ